MSSRARERCLGHPTGVVKMYCGNEPLTFCRRRQSPQVFPEFRSGNLKRRKPPRQGPNGPPQSIKAEPHFFSFFFASKSKPSRPVKCSSRTQVTPLADGCASVHTFGVNNSAPEKENNKGGLRWEAPRWTAGGITRYPAAGTRG
jgi:hypothetical protein